MPSAHLLTARLTLGQKVQILPLPDKSSSTSSSSLPSLRDIREAGTIRLKEISSVPLVSPNPPEGKQRDWLRLLLRESLGLFSPVHSSVGYLPALIVGHLRTQSTSSTLLVRKCWRLCMSHAGDASQWSLFLPIDRQRMNLSTVLRRAFVPFMFPRCRNFGRLAGILR